MQRLFIRDLELHTAVDDIAFQSVQADDLLIAAAVAEILLCNRPEGIAMYNGVNVVVLGGFRACHGKCRSLDRRHDTRLLYYGLAHLHLSQDEVWLMPFGLLLDLWECHKQYNGQATPAREHYIDDIIPEGI